MIRVLLSLLLFVVSSSAFAVKQYAWKEGNGAIHAVAENTCDAVKASSGWPLFWKCRVSGGVPFTTGPLDPTKVYFLNAPDFSGPTVTFTYNGALPDKCEPPRYTGPDTSKAAGLQCTRVACVAGDATGVFEEPIRYFVTSTGVTKQTFNLPGASQICQDGCMAKPNANSGNCPSRVHAGDISYQYCSQAFFDTATKCQHTDEQGTQPPYVPPADPPVDPPPPDPDPPTCGEVGLPECPDPTAPPPSCGVTGKPPCYPGGTCGGPGQPMCTGGDGSGPGGSTSGGGSTNGGGTTPQQPTGPSCGVEGKPACASDSTCGGVGQPACGYGDGSTSPGAGNGGSCGGLNQPACVIDGSGTPDGVGLRGDTSGLEAKHKEGADIIAASGTESLNNWFPTIPTAACVNPTVTGPFGGTYTFGICGYVDIFSVLVSAVISMFALFGSVRNVQDALKA